ncbi:MAG TPA: hypothetical protein VFY06_03970 [Verrucomicrobiae bacterium]|nr:hypothetical protein [Verrucomicrobiae bacterium]
MRPGGSRLQTRLVPVGIFARPGSLLARGWPKDARTRFSINLMLDMA